MKGFLVVFALVALVAAGCDSSDSNATKDAVQADSTKDTAEPKDIVSLDKVTPEDQVNPNDQPTPCPETEPVGQAGCSIGQKCKYGEECCCGECHDSMICDCLTDATWNCYYTEACNIDHCPDAIEADVATDADQPEDAGGDVTTVCPEGSPPIGQSGCQDGLHCEYGEECCCGECHASTVCDCEGHGWSCYATDACMIPGCPCVSDTDCENGSYCEPPYSPQTCGICMDVEDPCSTDTDCSAQAGTVCDMPEGGCYCNPVPMCVPACGAEHPSAMGLQCTAGHCGEISCATDSACPDFYYCTTGGICARKGCSSAGECGTGGFCVMGGCYEKEGLCEWPKP